MVTAWFQSGGGTRFLMELDRLASTDRLAELEQPERGRTADVNLTLLL